MADNPLGQDLSNAQDILKLVKSGGEMLGGMGSLRKDDPRKNREKFLLHNLGEWASKAKDKKENWYSPILKTAPFENHLKDNRGYFRPSGTSTSTFGWAHLLHALDITPDKGIVEWKPLSATDIDPVDSGRLPLVVDGKVLCHIINIYRVYWLPDPRSMEDQWATYRYELPFGKLKTSRSDDKILVTFTSDAPSELQKVKQPFRYDGEIADYLPGDHLEFTRDSVITKYFDTIKNDVSDVSMKFPEPDDPISQRVQKLVSGLKTLRTTSPNAPYLVTPLWMQDASRVYRRATSNASAIPTLPDDIATALREKAKENDYIKIFFMDSEELWTKTTIDAVKDQCMLPHRNIRFVWGANNRFHSSERPKRMALQFVQEEFKTLQAKFTDAPKDSPKAVIAENPEEMKHLLTTRFPHQIQNAPCVVLEFTRDHDLWKMNSGCQILC